MPDRTVNKGRKCLAMRRSADRKSDRKCQRGATKRGLCDNCYSRVYKGGVAAQTFKPFARYRYFEDEKEKG